MRAYFDTSALVPLLIQEPSTERCRAVWSDSELVVTGAIAYVEVHAALAQAARLGRLTARAHRRALDVFSTAWEDIARIDVSPAVIDAAATLTATHSLRGYDAVHCATAIAAASDDFVAVSGDRGLLRAWSALGLATVDTAG
jgi:predicted nucleic acid-binding protein